MAYVGISKSLLADVANAINKRRNAEQQASVFNLPDHIMLSQVTEEHHRMLWGEHYHLKDQIPTEWKNSTRRIDLQAKDSHDVTFSVQLRFPEDVYVPPNVSSWGAHIEVPADHPLIKDYAEQSSAISEIVKRWEDVKTKVNEFLSNCKSLNEAVKLWPEIKYYIPTAYLERLEEQKPKSVANESKAQQILKTIDTDSVVAAAVASRMTTPNV